MSCFILPSFTPIAVDPFTKITLHHTSALFSWPSVAIMDNVTSSLVTSTPESSYTLEDSTTSVMLFNTTSVHLIAIAEFLDLTVL